MSDKALHFATGFMLGLIFRQFGPGLGVAAAITAGIVKELADAFTYGRTVDGRDFLATVAGGVAAEFGVIAYKELA